MKKVINDIILKVNMIEEYEKLINSEENLMKQSSLMIKNYVHLNIGGAIFTVNKNTILKWGDSLLRYFFCIHYLEGK